MRLPFLLLLFALAASAQRGRPVVPLNYPLYKQCDPKWGSDVMQVKTICQVGCLMSSTAMALAGHNITIGTARSDPGVLNAWLRVNGGYVGGDMLEEAVVPLIDPARISWPDDADHRTNDIPMSVIMGYLHAGRPVIAHVNGGGHFVLVVGYDSLNADILYVNDPGYDRASYSYSKDVVGWRLYGMK